MARATGRIGGQLEFDLGENSSGCLRSKKLGEVGLHLCGVKTELIEAGAGNTTVTCCVAVVSSRASIARTNLAQSNRTAATIRVIAARCR